MGWELFLNYKIAMEKFKPDFFLYENNESAAEPIKAQIAAELGVPFFMGIVRLYRRRCGGAFMRLTGNVSSQRTGGSR